jgi:hypothetical protein
MLIFLFTTSWQLSFIVRLLSSDFSAINNGDTRQEEDGGLLTFIQSPHKPEKKLQMVGMRVGWQVSFLKKRLPIQGKTIGRDTNL